MSKRKKKVPRAEKYRSLPDSSPTHRLGRIIGRPLYVEASVNGIPIAKAKYEALIVGLELLLEMGVKNVFVKGDSQLVINQLAGTFICQSSFVISLYEIGQELPEGFGQVELQYLNRMYNDLMDELAQMASGYSKMLNLDSVCEYGVIMPTVQRKANGFSVHFIVDGNVVD
ncbi:Ribonuclease H [Abeliophyllum distichum]|uniref:Ribonuclease H n=1 Tax=Abeliophyllum distichum TaxID=126358 RepID=A0ABD1RTU3_9LAMI